MEAHSGGWKDSVAQELWAEGLSSSLLVAGGLPELPSLVGPSMEQLPMRQLLSLRVRRERVRESPSDGRRSCLESDAHHDRGLAHLQGDWCALLSPCTAIPGTWVGVVSPREASPGPPDREFWASRAWVQEEDDASSKKICPVGPGLLTAREDTAGGRPRVTGNAPGLREQHHGALPPSRRALTAVRPHHTLLLPRLPNSTLPAHFHFPQHSQPARLPLSPRPAPPPPSDLRFLDFLHLRK